MGRGSWRAVTKTAELTGRDVHVWRVWLDRPPVIVERLAAVLSPDERARADRFYFDRDRRRFIVARGALRRLLGGYVGVRAAAVQFTYGAQGKPALAGAASPAFNLSHSEDLALIAVAREGVLGIDVEAVRDVQGRDDIAAGFFSANENARLQSLPAQIRRQAFFSCWTRKEAFVKAVGDGLSHPLDTFEMTFAPGDAPQIAIPGDPSEASRWVVTALEPAAGFEAALVTDGPARTVKCWTWLESAADALMSAAYDFEEAV